MPSSESARRIEHLAARLGRGVGRIRGKLRRSRPDAKTAALGAIEAARPSAERARQFVKEHEEEIKRAGAMGAGILANRAAPPVLRPVVSALSHDLSKKGAKREPVDAGELDGEPDDRTQETEKPDKIF